MVVRQDFSVTAVMAGSVVQEPTAVTAVTVDGSQGTAAAAVTAAKAPTVKLVEVVGPVVQRVRRCSGSVVPVVNGGSGSDGGAGGNGGDGAMLFGTGGNGGNAGIGGVGGKSTQLPALGGAGGDTGWFGTHGSVGHYGTRLDAKVSDSSALYIEGQNFVNDKGEVVVLHSVNEGYKLPPYTPSATGFSEDDAKFLKDHGFNSVRLEVFWAAIEPKPGQYNDDYLASLKKNRGYAPQAWYLHHPRFPSGQLQH